MGIVLYAGIFVLILTIYVIAKVFPGLWRLYVTRTTLLRDFPTPDYHWFYGHLKVLPGINEAGLMWHHALCIKYPRYYNFIVGPSAVLQLNHPETIKQLTKTTEPKPTNSGIGYHTILPWIGDGLLLSKGDKWFRNRKLLTPGFHFDVLKPYVEVYNRCVENLLEEFEKSSEMNRSLEICEPVSLCALDIILRCAFSSTLEIQNNSGNKQYAKTVTELGKQVTLRALSPSLHTDFVYYKTAEGKRFRENCQLSHKVADDVINKRKLELNDTDTIENLSKKRYVDFLDILLLAKDEMGNGLTHSEIRDEVETFMFEGHDTTSSGMYWALYDLANNPEIQARARAEADNLLEGRSNDELEWNDMTQVPYLTQCIKESMRMHATVPIISREVTKPLPMDNKIIPVGVQIVINIWNLHHNPTVWNDPMTYDPDRFLPENMAKMDSHAFMPFSAGPRNCIGQNFAMNKMKTTIARIIRRFELSVDTIKEAKMKPEVVMRAENGIHIFFKNRK